MTLGFAVIPASLMPFFKVHPADVLKTRLQLPGAKPGLLRAAQTVWEERGVRGFLVGIGPRLVRKI